MLHTDIVKECRILTYCVLIESEHVYQPHEAAKTSEPGTAAVTWLVNGGLRLAGRFRADSPMYFHQTGGAAQGEDSRAATVYLAYRGNHGRADLVG